MKNLLLAIILISGAGCSDSARSFGEVDMNYKGEVHNDIALLSEFDTIEEEFEWLEEQRELCTGIFDFERSHGSIKIVCVK